MSSSCKRRPGGRTAQTRAAVFAAVEALLREQEPTELTMVQVAKRAGVAATSLYRRWGEVRLLLIDVAVARVGRDYPLPNTGSLRGDLIFWLGRTAAELASPEGSAFFRVYVSTLPRTPEEVAQRREIVGRRVAQLNRMLDIARTRGETTPNVRQLLDHLLGPVYMRALGGTYADASIVEELVEFLLCAVAADPQ